MRHGPDRYPPAPGREREASSAAFELVAVASGNELLIHLDRFATNEPVR